MSALLKIGLIGGAAWFFRSNIEAWLSGITSTATAAPTPTQNQQQAAIAAQVAATSATAAQVAAAQVAATQATDIATAARNRVDASSVPNLAHALSAMAAATPATLAQVEQQFGVTDDQFTLNVSQWNWYLAQGSSAPIITTVTEAGDNAITASTYVAMRQARGLISPVASVINAGPAQSPACPAGFTADAAGICTRFADADLLANLNSIAWTGLADIPAEQIQRIDLQILQKYADTTNVTAGSALAYMLGLGGYASTGVQITGSDGRVYTGQNGAFTRLGATRQWR